MSTDTPDEEPAGGAMTLLEHLAELRRRIIICAIAVTVGAVVVFVAWAPIISFLQGPYADVTATTENPDGQRLIFTEPTEAFLVRLKVATYGGIALAMPVLLWQLWRFVTPGLHRNEKRWTYAFVATGVPLFALGAGLAYLILPTAVRVLLNFTPGELHSFVTFDNYLDFVLRMLFVFGISFELPLILILANLSGMLSAARIRRWWRGMIFGIFVFAAAATPTGDPYTMGAMAAPMIMLYGLAVGITTFTDRRRLRRAAALARAAGGNRENLP